MTRSEGEWRSPREHGRVHAGEVVGVRAGLAAEQGAATLAHNAHLTTARSPSI